MSAITTRLIAAGFLLFLFLPLFGRALGVEPEPIENRPVAELPGATLAGVFDTEFYRGMTSYLIDTLPWRKHAVSTAAWLNLKVFHDSPSPQVHLGRDGWLFLDAAFRLPCRHDLPVSLIVEKLEQVAALVEESGRAFRFLITPNKHSIYPEFMSAAVRRLAECSENKRDELRHLLEQNQPPSYIDLFEQLEAMKRDQLRLLYFPNDSHLNSLGSSVQTAGIVDSLKPGLWESGFLIHLRERAHTGDLTRMLGFPSTVPSDWYRVHRGGVEVVAKSPVELPGGRPLRRFRASTRDSILFESRALIIHDSQMNLSMSMLQQFFADVSFLNVNAFTPAVALPLVRESGIIILQLSERGAYVRIAQQLGSQDFLEGLELLTDHSPTPTSQEASGS